MSSQFPDYPSAPNPPQKGGSLLWLWIVLGVLGALGLIGCLCCGGATWFGMSAGGMVLAQPYANNPTVVEQLGGIDSASMNIGAMSQEEHQKSQNIVLDVKGPKGRGQLILSEQRPQGDFNKAKLKIGNQEWDLKGGGAEMDAPPAEIMPDESAVPAPPGE